MLNSNFAYGSFIVKHRRRPRSLRIEIPARAAPLVMGVYKRVLYQKHGSPVAKSGAEPDHFGLIMKGVDKGQGSDIMTAFRRNEDAGGS